MTTEAQRHRDTEPKKKKEKFLAKEKTKKQVGHD